MEIGRFILTARRFQDMAIPPTWRASVPSRPHGRHPASSEQVLQQEAERAYQKKPYRSVLTNRYPKWVIRWKRTELRVLDRTGRSDEI